MNFKVKEVLKDFRGNPIRQGDVNGPEYTLGEALTKALLEVPSGRSKDESLSAYSVLKRLNQPDSKEVSLTDEEFRIVLESVENTYSGNILLLGAIHDALT